MVFARIRAFLASKQKRSGGLYDMISCVYCVSFWVGLLAALWFAGHVFQLFAYGLAFSAVSMLLEAFLSKNSNALALVTGPTTNDKVRVRAGSPSE